MHIFSSNYYRGDSKYELLIMQNYLIEKYIELHNEILTFDNFLAVISRLNNRCFEHSNGFKNFYNKVIDIYLCIKNIPENEMEVLRQKLLELCEAGFIANKYGDKKIALIRIDGDIIYTFYEDADSAHEDVLFLRKGKLSSIVTGADMSITPTKRCVEFVYNDKPYKIYAEDLECINWNDKYKDILKEVKNQVQFIEGEHDESYNEYEKEKNKILKARFNEEDKKRMLLELEEEYYGVSSDGIGTGRRK